MLAMSSSEAETEPVAVAVPAALFDPMVTIVLNNFPLKESVVSTIYLNIFISIFIFFIRAMLRATLVQQSIIVFFCDDYALFNRRRLDEVYLREYFVDLCTVLQKEIVTKSGLLE